MIILITGANFNNKGAQLMLYALNDKLRHYFPSAIICVSPLLGNYETLKQLNIKTLDFPLYHYGTPFSKYNILGKFKFKIPFLIPILSKLQLKYKGLFESGDISLKDVDLVMDISGYAFGDKWGNLATRNLIYFVKKMRKYGSKFFLLPQAFGPFSDTSIKRDIRNLIQNIDLIFARDEASYEYLIEYKADSNNIHIAPDITLSYNALKYENKDLPSNYCTIVPNSQMLIRAGQSWQENYVKVLEKTTSLILETSRLSVVVLIHAQKNSFDNKIGDELYRKYRIQFPKRIFLYQEDNPLTIKSIISKSKFVFGSRFHALASALSSNVPCISTSWLHKYEMLFKDYKCEDYNFTKPEDVIFSKIGELLDDENRKKIISRLIECNKSILERESKMWNLILKNTHRLYNH